MTGMVAAHAANWTDPVITATDLPSFNDRAYGYRRREVCDLLRAHGLDPHNVKAIRYQVIDCPVLTVTLIRWDETGRIMWDRDQGVPIFREADVLLRHPLPEWWRPQ
jgi:hypothetical protein